MMRAEVLLAVAVLGASGALTQLPSPRSVLPTSEQKDNTITQLLLLDDLVGELRISPNLVGQNEYRVELRDAAGGAPRDPVREVRLHFRFEDPSVGPIVIPTLPSGGDRFELRGAFFGLAGRWTVAVEVRRDTRDDVIGEIETEIEQGFISVLPFGQSEPGALALPLSQMDWNGVGALTAAVIAGLLIAYRRTLRERVSLRAGDAAMAGGTLFMTLTVVLAIGIHVDPGRTLENPVERSEESVARGGALFANNCQQCHGAAGGGDGPLAGTLPNPPANFRVHVPFHQDGVLFAWISDGIPGTGMPSFSDGLSEQERWDLVNFLRGNFDQPLGADGATARDATPYPPPAERAATLVD